MGFLSDSALNSFNLHNKPPGLQPFTPIAPEQINKKKTSQQSNRKWIYNERHMFMANFYLIEKKFYTDNVCTFVTNSMSARDTCHVTHDTWQEREDEPSLKISASWLLQFGSEGFMKIFNRPDVAGAFLQTPSSLIHWFTNYLSIKAY